jgi:hypothetical protein
MKIQFVIATISKISLLCYLFKERLIFFFNEYSLINNVKEAFVRIRSVMERFAFYLLFNKKKSIENNITFFFNFYTSFLDSVVPPLGKKLEAEELSTFHTAHDLEKSNIIDKQSFQEETLVCSAVAESEVAVHPY